MAGKGTIGGKIVLEGEKEYNAALKNIKANQKELRSEMKLCASEYKTSQNSLEALTKKHELLSKQFETQKSKISVYESALEASTQKQQTAADKITELESALEDANKKMDEMAKSADTSSEAMEDQKNVISDLENKLQLANDDYDKASQTTKNWQTALNNATADLNGMADELNETDKYIQEAENSTDQCATSIDEFGRETEEATQKTSIFGDVLKADLLSSAIQAGLRNLANGIRDIAKSSVEVGSSFEAGMSQVAATMGMTSQEIENGSEAYTKMAAAAKECGATTKFTATEAAEALNYLALAGYDADKAVETLPKVLNLAAAGGMDLAYASDLVTDSMAALGMETNQLDNYIDQMARTAQKSNTSVAQLGEASLVCAGTVSLTGQEISTMNTELGILANNGIKGAEGGTHLRNVLLSLSAPTDKAAVALKNLGIEIQDKTTGGMRDLNDIMIDLNAALSEMGDVEKTAKIKQIFNKTDIAAVNALLKGSVTEYADLKAKIEDCAGAARDMAETMNSNLKGKITILQSALEGLGIAAFEVFDDSMKKGVDSATSAVDKLTRSITRGDLGKQLERLADALDDFVEGAISAGEKALPSLINGLTWVLENGDQVIALMTGVVSAMAAQKVVTAAAEAWEAYKRAGDAATIMQELLNTTMLANPVVAITTALVGLTAATVAYCMANEDVFNTTTDVTDATNKLVNSARDLNATIADNSQTRQEERADMEQSAEVTKKLADELMNLQSKTSLTASEQARQKAIVDQLNGAIPDLNLEINNQTGFLTENSKAQLENIDAMLRRQKAAAAEEDLARIAEDQYQAEKKLAELQGQVTDGFKDAASAREELNRQLEIANSLQGENNTEIDNARQAYANARQANIDLRNEIEATQQTIANLGTEYETTLGYIEDTTAIDNLSGSLNGVSDAAGSMSGGVGDALSGVNGALTESEAAALQWEQSLREAFADAREDITETIQNQMNIFEQFSAGVEISSQQILDNMQSQIDGISEWADNLEALAERGINQGLLQTLAEMGPEGASYVQAFVQMTDEELQKAGDMYVEAMSLPDDAAQQIEDSFVEVGKNVVAGLSQGIEESKGDAVDQTEQMAEETIEAAENAFETHSPSKKFDEIGQNLDKGLQQGMQSEQSQTVTVMQNICNEIYNTANNELQQSKFKDIGRNITEGLKAGIHEGRSGVVNEIKQMCAEAVSAAKEQLKIQSPSKEFAYLGRMSGEGYTAGWTESMKDINRVIANTLPDISGIASSLPVAAATPMGGNVTYIDQDIVVNTPTPDLVETSRQFKEAQKEAAKAW